MPGGGGGIHRGTGGNSSRKDWIPVPDDPVLANSVCPICQEKFEMRWLDEAQEFIWPDATRVGDRIYHASCHREATKDDVTMLPIHGGVRGTPEPVLGKRKAEVSSRRCPYRCPYEIRWASAGKANAVLIKQNELTSMRGKMKMEAT